MEKSTSRFKINLFDYITRFGVGDLFVKDDKTDSVKFINYFNNDILPSIIDKVGYRFVLQLDNASFHVSKLSLEYYKRLGLNILIWSPNSPDLNII